MREPKRETLRFRCTESLANQIRAAAAAQRRDVPDLLRLILEDWAATQEATTPMQETPVRYQIRKKRSKDTTV